MARQLFISYARTDHQLVLPLLDQLRADGFEPWLDQSSIPVSVPWLDEIEKAIRSAELFLAIDSPAWRGSSNCRTELQIAQSLGKGIVRLNPTLSTDWRGIVAAAYGQLGHVEVTYAKLLGDSCRWQAAGRRAPHLASGRLLKEYRRVLRTRPNQDVVAAAFVAHGVRAARLRSLRAGLAVTLTVALFLGFQTSRALQDHLNEVDQERAAELEIGSTVNGALGQEPYRGLRQAIAFAIGKGADNYSANAALASALDLNLPESIDNPSGKPPRPAIPLPDARLLNGKSRASLDAATNVVEVSGPKGPLRITARGAVTAMAWSPEGDRLAIADAAGVSLIRLPQGRMIARLRGLDGAVDQLRWPAQDRVEARAGLVIATWRLPGTMLARTSSWFMGLAANPDGSKALAVSRDGGYTLIARTTVAPSVRVPGLSVGAAVTWAGGNWAISGQGSGADGLVAVVSQDGKLERTWSTKGCFSESIAPGQGSTVLLACTDAQTIRTLDLTTGEFRDAKMPEARPRAAILDQDGSILAVSEFDELIRVSASGANKLLRGGTSLCADGAQLMVASSDRSRVLIGGRKPNPGCTLLAADPKDRGSAHAIIARGTTLYSLRAATWTNDGSALVTGWGSGQLWFFNTDILADRLIVSPTGSEIRGLAFNSGQSALLIVTRDGEVLSFPAGAALASFGDRVKLAQQRLGVGIDAGLA